MRTSALCGLGQELFQAHFCGVLWRLKILFPKPLISLLAGILILVMPKLLNFIVAIYLIVIGLIGLFGTGALRP